MINVGFLFHSSGNDNLGVGALTVSDLEILREVARERDVKIRVTLIDGRNQRKPCVGGPDVTILALQPLRKPWTFYSTVRRCDLIVDIGGGDSLSDIYGWKRFAKMHLQKYLVHIAGRPLVLAPQTIGPFKSRLFGAIAAFSIRRATIIATRDSASKRALREMGVANPVIEASDVALRLPFTPPIARKAGPVRVGLNVSGLLASGGYTRDNMFGLRMDYPELMRRIISSFLQHSDNCEVHLVAHVIASGQRALEDDLKACRDLAAEFPGVLVAPAFETPTEAKSYIANLDFFMGARMHACVAAFSAGVPVVPMAYSRKFAGLFGSLGYDHTVDCTIDSAEDILARIFDAYEKRELLAIQTRDALQVGLTKLKGYEDALGDILERTTASRT
jgi:polysaccharide pyruvyl transferase WcaK-like protein